jgi:CubicO group peptidase (beta-lactamase class C family)
MTEIYGICDEKFVGVKDEFERNFSERGDVGASFALTVDGAFVVDLWAGYQDAAHLRPWREDTLVNVFSSTKTMTFLCVLILADRGQLDLESPVALYWPEFAANGKEQLKVKHLLSHSAGLPGFSRHFEVSELCDWQLCSDDLAAQASWWKPGTQSGYHAITQGYLVGEVVRRISRQTLGQFFKFNVADPIGADFHIGVKTADFSRIADLVPAPGPSVVLDLPADSIPSRVFTGLGNLIEMVATSEWRHAEIPAVNGHGNARSIVRAQTAVANAGKAFGVELLSLAGCLTALEPQVSGVDLVLGTDLNFGMGYALSSPAVHSAPNVNARTLWWGGAGGSSIVLDLEANVCFSYVMNQMGTGLLGDIRGASLAAAVYKSL